MLSQLSLNESCNCTDRSVPGVAFDEKESAAGNRQMQKARVSANPPLRHHYLDELAVRSVRRQKLAAGDREIDLLRPFVAAKMWRDVPNFVAVRGPGVGNEWVPCSYRSELAD
jgi:hypothetical protein